MRAMVFRERGDLHLEERERPVPAADQILIKVEACGVCRTDLHIADGDITPPRFPIIPGHEIVGRVEQLGESAARQGKLKVGQRVGVPWLAWTCGDCNFCRAGEENLCDRALFTGFSHDGGYAEYTTADCRYAFALPENIEPAAFSPMLCAGLIGWRSLRFARPALEAGEGRLGIYGFGAAGHIIAQVARTLGFSVYAMVRPGDRAAADFALQLGAAYAGPSDGETPEKLDAAIIFASAGELVPAALKTMRKGGSLVLGGIHMSDIPSMPYSLIWGERRVQSVANLTQRDGVEFIAYLTDHNVTTKTETLPLEQANQALARLASGQLSGALVLKP